MFDIHPPHPIHGWRDFFVQLLTITAGLLIALALEGSVEWLHHRHLRHEAETALRKEINTNAATIAHRLEVLQLQQQSLAADIGLLDKLIAHPEERPHDSMTIAFDIVGFADVSWNTAQATGAMAYVPYDLAQQYSDIYAQQAEIDAQVHVTLRDVTVSMGPFLGMKPGDPLPSAEDATLIKHNLQTLRSQLYLLEQLDQTMGEMYKRFSDAHPK